MLLITTLSVNTECYLFYCLLYIKEYKPKHENSLLSESWLMYPSVTALCILMI